LDPPLQLFTITLFERNSAINRRFSGDNSSLKYVFEGLYVASHPAI
jgi:hypothetical protein